MKTLKEQNERIISIIHGAIKIICTERKECKRYKRKHKTPYYKLINKKKVVKETTIYITKFIYKLIDDINMGFP